MASSAGSELPLHYGSKTADGEIIKRPQTPPNVLASPQRVYRPYTEPQPVIPSRANPSPEGIPVNADRQSFDAENPRAGLRRRPSTQPGSNPRRYSGGDYERPNYFPESGGGSRKGTMRSGSRDDAWYDERDRSTAPLRREEFSHPHPDSLERSRPPRSYRNVEGWEKRPSSASKPYFDESRGDYDVERGRDDWAAERAERRQRSIEYEESVDGYNYEQQKNPHRHPPKIDFKNMTKEERAQVMRLPWTQWMNSSVKNRKFIFSILPIITILIIAPRLRGHPRRVRRHHHVPLLRLRRHPSRQHPVLSLDRHRFLLQHYDRRHYRLQCLRLPLYFGHFRLLAHGQRLDFFPHQRWSL